MSRWISVWFVLAVSMSAAQEARPVVYEQKPVELDWPIAYVRNIEGRGTSLWLTGGELKERRKVSSEYRVVPEMARGEPALAWSPNGSRLAFVAETGKAQKLLICDSKGETLSDVMGDLKATEVAYLAWSPAGTYLAFSLTKKAGAAAAEEPGVYVCTASGRIHRKVSGAVRAGRARWSPTGKLVSFQGYSQNQPAIFIVSPRSTEPQRVAGTEQILGSFAWSADEQYLAFEGGESGTRAQGIYVCPSQGGKAVLVSREAIAPKLVGWASSAHLLAFTAARPDGTSTIFVTQPPWLRVTNVLAGLGEEYSLEPTTFGSQPISALWSPTGAKLAFIAGPADQALGKYLYVWDAAGAAQQVSRPVEVHDFRWLPDSKRLVFIGRRSAVGKLAPSAYLGGLGMEPVEVAPNVVAYGMSSDGRGLATLHVANVQGTHALAVRMLADRSLQWIDRDVEAFAVP